MTVPLWLQASKLYRESLAVGMELNCELFDTRFLRDNFFISSLSDFKEVMQCIDYWGVDCWPDGVYSFIANNIPCVLKWRSTTEMSVAKHSDINEEMLNDFNARKACELGCINWLVFFFNLCDSDPKQLEWCNISASAGHLSCLEYAHTKGCPWSEYTCELAARGDHLACLEFCHTNGCPWDEKTCKTAARNGRLSCLEYALSNNCPCDFDYCCYESQRNSIYGNSDCLKCLYRHGANSNGRWRYWS